MNRERLQRITIDAGKCGGRPCIRGLRIRVTDILELLGAGASFDEILKDYPFLERRISSPPLTMPRTKQITLSSRTRKLSINNFPPHFLYIGCGVSAI